MARKIDKLGITLARILKAQGLEGRLDEYRVVREWDRAVGPAVASHAQPLQLRGGKLFVVVDSPAWMQQLSLLRPQIIEKLTQRRAGGRVKEIVLRLGEVKRSGEGSLAPEAPAPVLSDEDRDLIAKYIAAVADEETRESLRRVLEKDVLSRKKKRA